MSASQREAHLKKVASAKLHENAASSLLHLSSRYISSSDQAGPSGVTVSDNQLVLNSESSHNKSSYSYHMPSAQNQSSYDSINYDDIDEISGSSHCYTISVSLAPQQEAFKEAETYTKPSCSRRLFASQCQSIADGDSLPASTTIPTCSVQCHSSMPSHQYVSSTIASTSQIHTAPSLTRTSLPSSDSFVSEDKLLSVAISDFSGSDITPVEVLKAIWRKAYELLHEPNSVLHAPGQGDNTRMVKSYSGSRPHLVSRKKNGQYACDSMCPNWRSLGICAHSVAAAEDNKELQLFVQWYLKAKKVPNLTKLATTEMPAGRGRKGSKAPPKKKSKVQPDSRVPFSIVAGVQDKESNCTSGSSSMNLFDLPEESQAASSTSVGTKLSQSFNSFNTETATLSIGNAESSLSPGNLIMNATNVNIHPSEIAMPVAPPPLIHCTTPTTSSDTSPLTLTFITGNIRVCRGCRQKYLKPAPPPLNLCVKHQEWQEFI